MLSANFALYKILMIPLQGLEAGFPQTSRKDIGHEIILDYQFGVQQYRYDHLLIHFHMVHI